MEKARFKWVLRERNRKIAAKTEVFTEQQARRVRSFHSGFKEFTDFQEDFYAKMQAGTMPTAEEQAAVQELGQKVEANALLKEYLAAQQGLSVYLNDIERIIFKPLQELNS